MFLPSIDIKIVIVCRYLDCDKPLPQLLCHIWPCPVSARCQVSPHESSGVNTRVVNRAVNNPSSMVFTIPGEGSLVLSQLNGGLNSVSQCEISKKIISHGQL